MLKPSIDELLKEVNSRFALTIVIAKRARQLQLNPDDYKVETPVGHDNNEVAKSLEELNSNKLEYFLSREEAELAQNTPSPFSADIFDEELEAESEY
jgi:DNA-directed RNA polymerase, omega subunit